MNRSPTLALVVYCAAVWTLSACSNDAPTETARRGPMTALGVPALQLRGLKPNPWDTDDPRLTAAIRAADGYGVVAFKSPTSQRILETDGFRAAVPATAVDKGIALLKSRDVEIISVLSSMGAARVRFANPEVAADLRKDPLIDYVAPRVRLKLTMTPDVAAERGVAPLVPPIARAQMAEVVPWGVTMIRAPESWATTTGNNVKVMLLVPGGPGPHADLPNFDPNHCGGPWWHVCDGWEGGGLFMYGQIASPSDQWGIVGVAPSAPVANLYAWNPCAQDSSDPQAIVCYDDQMASAIDVAVLVGAKLFTFGYFGWEGDQSPFLPNAVARGWSADIVLVGSAGTTNAYSNNFYPAHYPDVIGVSGVKQDRGFATGVCTANGAPFGPTYGPDVDVAAPFIGFGTWPINTFQNYCGAWTMTDYVLGVLMLIRSKNPTWTNQQVVDRLYATATDCGPAGRDDQFGNGVVDAAAALGVLPRQTCSTMPVEPGITSVCAGPYTHERIYYTNVTLTQNSPGTTLTLQRQYNGGAWTTIATWANAPAGTYTKTRAGNGSFRANANNGSVSSPWTATITRSCG